MASLKKRAIAFFIDWLILSVVQAVLIGIFVILNIKTFSPYTMVHAVLIATSITICFFLLKDINNGMSIGKRIMKIKIRSEDNPMQDPNVAKLIIRNALAVLWPIEALLLVQRGSRLGITTVLSSPAKAS